MQVDLWIYLNNIAIFFFKEKMNQLQEILPCQFEISFQKVLLCFRSGMHCNDLLSLTQHHRKVFKCKICLAWKQIWMIMRKYFKYFRKCSTFFWHVWMVSKTKTLHSHSHKVSCEQYHCLDITVFWLKSSHRNTNTNAMSTIIIFSFENVSQDVPITDYVKQMQDFTQIC